MSNIAHSGDSTPRQIRARRESTPRSRRASGQGPLFDAVNTANFGEDDLALLNRLERLRSPPLVVEDQDVAFGLERMNYEVDEDIVQEFGFEPVYIETDVVQRRRRRRSHEAYSQVEGAGTEESDKFDLRALDYVLDVDNNLICPICQCPFLKPIQLECDHSFCADCLQKSYEMRNTTARPCPTCRRPHSKIVERPAPRYVTRMLDELVVKCPNVCGMEVKRGEVQNHVDSYCSLSEVPCKHEGCEKTIGRKDVDKACLHGQVVCESCGKTMMERNIEVSDQACVYALIVVY